MVTNPKNMSKWTCKKCKKEFERADKKRAVKKDPEYCSRKCFMDAHWDNVNRLRKKSASNP
jgi:transposase-like protein